MWLHKDSSKTYFTVDLSLATYRGGCGRNMPPVQEVKSGGLDTRSLGYIVKPCFKGEGRERGKEGRQEDRWKHGRAGRQSSFKLSFPLNLFASTPHFTYISHVIFAL